MRNLFNYLICWILRKKALYSRTSEGLIKVTYIRDKRKNKYRRAIRRNHMYHKFRVYEMELRFYPSDNVLSYIIHNIKIILDEYCKKHEILVSVNAEVCNKSDANGLYCYYENDFNLPKRIFLKNGIFDNEFSITTYSHEVGHSILHKNNITQDEDAATKAGIDIITSNITNKYVKYFFIYRNGDKFKKEADKIRFSLLIHDYLKLNVNNSYPAINKRLIENDLDSCKKTLLSTEKTINKIIWYNFKSPFQIFQR